MPSNQELNHQDPEISDVSESRESVPELGITNETAKSIGLLRVMAMLALVGGAGGCISGGGLSESQMDELKRKIGAPYLGPHRKGAAHCFTGDDDVEMKRKAINENLKVSGLKEGEVENRRAALGIGGKWTVCVNSVKKETAEAYKDELLEKIGAKYDGPQKGGESFVAFASGSTEKKARNNAKDKIRKTFPRFKVTAFKIKEISKDLYAVAMRGEVEKESVNPSPDTTQPPTPARPLTDAEQRERLMKLYGGKHNETVPNIPGQKRDSANQTGSLDSAFINANKGALINCYNRALKKNPSLRGKVVVTITVSSKGRVTNVAFKKNSLNDTTCESCIEDVVKRWRLPQNANQTVAFPLIFAGARY